MVVLILSFWSGVLLWGTLEVARMIRELAEERKELRRWKRLQGIYDSQRAKWQ